MAQAHMAPLVTLVTAAPAAAATSAKAARKVATAKGKALRAAKRQAAAPAAPAATAEAPLVATGTVTVHGKPRTVLTPAPAAHGAAPAHTAAKHATASAHAPRNAPAKPAGGHPYSAYCFDDQGMLYRNGQRSSCVFHYEASSGNEQVCHEVWAVRGGYLIVRHDDKGRTPIGKSTRRRKARMAAAYAQAGVTKDGSNVEVWGAEAFEAQPCHDQRHMDYNVYLAD